MTCVWLAAFSLAGAQTWHVPEAPYRARIERAAESAWPADAGFVWLWPNGMETRTLNLSVFSKTGSAAGHKILWVGEGEPLKILFDCSSRESTYYVYFGRDVPAAVPGWNCETGTILETRRRGEGTAESWEDLRRLWDDSPQALGRSPVSSIHHGIHLHGPTENFLSYYMGFLNIEKDGKYAFATVSDDASFLLIDGGMVAEWPGSHGVSGGRRGQHSGSINLTAGRHRIEYYNAQDGTGFSVSAAWKMPGKKYFEIIPAAAFAPLARFAAAGLESAQGSPVEACFEWEIAGHTTAGGMSLVYVRLKAVGKHGDLRYKWTFDDGATGRKSEILHLFPRPGIRTVRLDVLKKKKRVASVTEKVNVHPRWSQRNEWPEHLFHKQKAQIMAADLSSMPLVDLAYLVRFADSIEDRQILNKCGVSCMAGKDRFGPEQADVFYKLGFHFQHPGVRRYRAAEEALRTVLALDPSDSALTNRARLHLAGLLIHCAGDAEVGQALLSALSADGLDGADGRLKKIYEADALLTLGDVERARETYLSIGDVVAREDISYAVRRRARLEAAKDFIRRGEYDAVEDIIRAIEWETPLERLDTETGLVMIKMHIGRKEYPFAFSHCRRLLTAAPVNKRRADVLLCLVETSFAMGKTRDARQALTTLLEEHPYSEAAARAKDRWASRMRRR